MNTTEQRRPVARATLVAPVWLMIASLLPAPAEAQAQQELWVLGESAQIFVVDTRTLAVDPSPISLLDSSAPDTPTCMAFSAVAGLPLSAFVTQGRFVRVVDVATRTVLASRIDVAQLLGLPDIDLTACAAAAPRSFQSGTSLVTRSHLFVAGNLPGGAAYWAVLDQRSLIAGNGTALVDSGRLHSIAAVLDAAALDATQGDSQQRAWFTLIEKSGGSEALLNIPLSLPVDAAQPASLGPAEVLALPTSGLPLEGVGVGVSLEGQLPIQPGFVTGQLTHLETGASCVVPGNPTQLAVHGPGPNSYTVFALDPLNADVLAIDPNDCSSVAFDVGGGPVALVPRRGHFWDGLFVINNVGDSISFLGPAGGVVALPLPQGTGPIDGGIAQSPPCAVENLLLDKVGNDIELTWSAPGCGGAEFAAWCNCIGDDADCPCACDCSAPEPDPDCACPFAQGAKASRGFGGGFLINYDPGDHPTTNPWKKLESTPETTLDHEGVLTEGSWFYLINQSDEAPDP